MPRLNAAQILLSLALLSPISSRSALPEEVTPAAVQFIDGEDAPAAPPASIGEKEAMERLYQLLKGGSVEDLRAECRRRGISDQGDLLTLKRRLIEHQRGLDAVSLEKPGRELSDRDILLDHADFIEYSEDERGNGLVWLRGNVEVRFAGKEIKADEVSINTGTKIVTGSGNILFTDKEKQYRASSFSYDASVDEGFFDSANTSLGKFIYTGRSIKKLPQGDKFEGEAVTLTTCPLEDPHYWIEADRLYVYDNERVLIKNASFYYGSEPVLRLPYLYRRLKERAIKSSISFRERSGLAAQNTYYPFKTDARELVLKGDFYERLGLYAGTDFVARQPKGETSLGASAAISNDIYFYDTVRENWSPLGPPGAGVPSTHRSLRYRAYLGERFQFGAAFDNTLELNLGWISDPYYQYDFERRSEQLDLFAIIGQAEGDYPRVGSGFNMDLNDTFLYRNLSISLKNRARFEPQRNSREPEFSLPDYYQYRIYTMTAPELTLIHSARLFEESPSAVFSGVDYRGLGRYQHTIYFDDKGNLSSELHGVETSTRFTKGYFLSRYVRLVPTLEVGAQGQAHSDPSSAELADDRQKTLLYGRTNEELILGGTGLSLSLIHDLKYKILGPEDLYQYGRFRVHELKLTGFAGGRIVTDTLSTSYDLRPVYNWGERRYEGSLLEWDRFSPLINTLTLIPLPVLYAADKLVYDIAAGRMKTNSFRLNYTSKAVYLRKCELKANWDLVWEHSFESPLLDTLSSVFGVGAKPHPLWTFSFSVLSRNDELWKYFPESARERGIDPISPLTDLLKSYNFFNRKEREESNFKLKSISIGFSHDLHDWVLKGGYTGNRELSYDGKRYIWNNTYSVSLSLKEVRNFDIHTEFNDRR